MKKLFLIICIFLLSASCFAVGLEDEGVHKGWPVKLNCIGAGVTCASTGNLGTITIGGGAGATAWDDIEDPDADATVAFAGYEQDITSTLDEANHTVLTITNTDADRANNTTTLRLADNDAGDVNVFWLQFTSNADGSPAVDFQIAQTATATATQINLGATGVLIYDDADGAITFKGNSAGADEDLTLNLDDTADTIDFTSSTGVDKLDFSDFDIAFKAVSIEAGAYVAASIDGDDINSNIAGRSLTLTGASPDTLDVDAELYTDFKGMTIETPTDADNFFAFEAPIALIVTRVTGIVESATSAVLTWQECDAAGDNCSTIEAVTADVDGTISTDIDNSGIDAGDIIRLDVGTVTGTVGQAHSTITFTKND